MRLIPNTPSVLGRGVLGYLSSASDVGLNTLIEDLFSPLGLVLYMKTEEELETLMITCSSGVGFIYELMIYFQEWAEERGIPHALARKMIVETFLGTSLLAQSNAEISLEELQSRVASRKGITEAGLNSMRELELERILRVSFEKSSLRNQEFSKS